MKQYQRKLVFKLNFLVLMCMGSIVAVNGNNNGCLIRSGAIMAKQGGVLVSAQKATIREEYREIGTYPYNDPDRRPVLLTRPAIYPYFQFNGYTDVKTTKKWKVVTLENDYIKVEVLPEVGGKIWGAIEKSSNYDFIYKNDVIKFRNIAMRGPWTSGGIEFNFGIQGHTPATAAPVDYVLQENPDSSVSCVVGSIDLPSRTEWRIRITLPKDKAFFELEALWYNPHDLGSSYYYWTNAAVRARPDAQFFYPGNYYMGHSGDVHPWPVDSTGRDLSLYKNNCFGENKTYHVFGDSRNFKAIYWNELGLGTASWAVKSDLPGKKLWFWSPARSGEIWKDLLTDHSGQYIEIQSGRLFNQANMNSGMYTPFRQNSSTPYQVDTWHELWMPLKGTGGVKDVSPFGVLNVIREGQSILVNVQALQKFHANLVIKTGEKLLFDKPVNPGVMQVVSYKVPVPSGEHFTVDLQGTDLFYDSGNEQGLVGRPEIKPELANKDVSLSILVGAEEKYKYREYDQALEGYKHYLEKNPYSSLALSRIAELYYRRNENREGLVFARKALALDTYDPVANFVYSQIERKEEKYDECMLALGLAARSPAYASPANTLLAEISVEMGKIQKASFFAKQALANKAENIAALKILAICARKNSNQKLASDYLDHILTIDPLCHFALYEKYLLNPDTLLLRKFNASIRSEIRHEAYLELALYYRSLKLNKEAIDMLEMMPETPMAYFWLAFLQPEKADVLLKKAVSFSPDFVFPFRSESEQVLESALNNSDHWKIKYYLGLLKWSLYKKNEAMRLFEACKNVPDYAPFYLTRGALKVMVGKKQEEVRSEYLTALSYDRNEWRAYQELTASYLADGDLDNAMMYSKRAAQYFPGHFYSKLNHAVVLLYTGEYEKCLDLLAQGKILPNEGGTLGHEIYEKANLFLALKNIEQKKFREAIRYIDQARKWPENTGAGEPYNPDNRPQDFLTAYCYDQMNQKKKSVEHYRKVIAYDAKENKRYADDKNKFLAVLANRLTGNNREAENQFTRLTTVSRDARWKDWMKSVWNKDTTTRELIKKSVLHSYGLKLPGIDFYSLIKMMEIIKI